MRRCIWSVTVLVAAAALLLVPAAGQAGGAPAIAWSPTTSDGTYDYGAVTVGQTASQTFTLTNSGGRATGTLAVALSGSSAFTITADGCSARSLAPTKSCDVTVQYAPTAGGSDTATLTATGEHASASLTLTGSGTVPGHVYWGNLNAFTIGRASLDGTGANQSFITGASFPVGVAVDAG